MAATVEICDFNQFGYCKFGDRCTKQHICEVCDKSECSVINCDFRHPRLCKYYKIYKRCKFTSYCKYKHEENNSETKYMETKNKDLRKKSETLESTLAEVKISLETSLMKIETFENKLQCQAEAMVESVK